MNCEWRGLGVVEAALLPEAIAAAMDELIRNRSAMTLEVAISLCSSNDVIALNWWTEKSREK